MDMLPTGNDAGLLGNDETWLRLRDALLVLSGTPFVEPEIARERLLRTAAEALRINRVSLWLFTPGQTGILCVALFEKGKGMSRPGTRIPPEAAPEYFKSLQGLLTLAAADAHRDPRTRQLEADYLKPLGIGALLDVPVRQFGELIGVLCHEHIGESREWLDTERIFAAAIGALCSQTLEFERLRKVERARDHAIFHDQLTGLPNRALFLNRLESAREEGDASLLVLDIDGFGEIVEAYGPAAGDAVLLETSRRLAIDRRRQLAGRIGNDEFALLMTGDHAISGAVQRASELRTAMLQPMAHEAQDLHASFSIGVVPSIRHYASAMEALRDAEIAQCSAARAGRDCIRIFELGMEEPIRRRLELEADIRRAIDGSEFVFHLQPIFSRNGQLQGAEALMRWQHPERGLLAPADFLEVAEETGLLPRMQRPLLNDLLRTVHDWRITRCPEFVIGVNISSAQLALADFPEELVASVSDAGLPAAALSIEITENSLLANQGRDLPSISRLAGAGMAVSLDDFGTGYASITHLAQLPLKSVKIDRTFVDRAVEDTRYAAIINALVSLAGTLSLNVVAEGVETEAQQALLIRSGCNQLQGFHLGRPQSIADFESRWLS